VKAASESDGVERVKEMRRKRKDVDTIHKYIMAVTS
jgi:hypothetical protein